MKGRERGIPAALIDLLRRNFLAGQKDPGAGQSHPAGLYLFCEACGRIAACPRCGGAAAGGQGTSGSPAGAAPIRNDAAGGCPRCGRPLEPLHDISIDSLSLAVERVSGEAAVLSLTAAELKDPLAARDAGGEHPVVIATLAALNPVFQGIFAAAVWVKPESFFSTWRNTTPPRLIHACGAEIAGTLAAGGELHVFSVFHFHYALQYLLDEEAFFERELKYRQWFLLPPFAGVYELELRDAGLRSLAAAMRALYGRHRDGLHMQRIYLASRQTRARDLSRHPGTARRTPARSPPPACTASAAAS